jgi:hypothetical protein
LTFAGHHVRTPDLIVPVAKDPAVPPESVPIVSLIAYASIVIAAIAAMPVWPWSRDWGNGNAGALAYILLVVSINAAIGQIH